MNFPANSKKLPWIELFPPNHVLADSPPFAQRRCHLRIVALCFTKQSVELFVEEPSDQLRGVWHGGAAFILYFNTPRVAHTLRDHQAVNPIGGQVFHVAIEQARAFSVEHAVAVADHRANRSAGARERTLAYSCRKRT